MTEKPDGLALAARMRSGEKRLSPSRLWGECEAELREAKPTPDQLGEHYRHAMIHAGAVGPKTTGEWKAFTVCPTCNAELGEWNARIDFVNE